MGALQATRFHHRRLILQQFGVAPFEQVEVAVRQQVTYFARQQMNPVAVFRSAVDTLRARRWEVTRRCCDIISGCYRGG